MTTDSAQTDSASTSNLIMRLFEIIDGRTWDDLKHVFAEDCLYIRPGYEPLVGLRAVEHFYRFDRIVASGQHDIERVVSDSEAAACWGRFQGRSRSGQLLNEGFADGYVIRAARLVERRTYFFRPAI